MDTLAKELGRESDRGLVLIAAAFLEENLAMLLRSLMRKGGKKLEENVLKPLFRSDGPLGSFAGKIRICYAMELIDEVTYKDLEIVRDIRNDFAHTYSEANFTTGAAKNRIGNMRYDELLTRLIPTQSDVYFQFDRDGKTKIRVTEERRKFLIAFIMLSATLEGAVREFRKRQDAKYPQTALQGARANDHGCHVSCSEQHEPRQPRSWLILNVSQKMTCDLHQLLPENFRELLAALLAIFGVAFAFIALRSSSRDYGLRATGLLMVAFIALFANNPWCYFAAVFIIATAVTQLEFLQNLAAIIRGSKEYFDYQKQFIPPKDVAKNVGKEVAATEYAAKKEKVASAGETASIPVSGATRMSAQHFGLIIEELAFKYLERKFKKPIERHVRIIGKNAAMELDGVMREEGFDRVFEIKASRVGFFPTDYLFESVSRIAARLGGYEEITRRRAELHFVFVGNLTDGMRKRIDGVRERIMQQYPALSIHLHILSFDDVGFKPEENAG